MMPHPGPRVNCRFITAAENAPVAVLVAVMLGVPCTLGLRDTLALTLVEAV